MGWNSTVAVAAHEVTDAELAALGIVPTGETVPFDAGLDSTWLETVAVTRFDGFTVIAETDYNFVACLDEPASLTGTWFIGTAADVSDIHLYGVVREGETVRALRHMVDEVVELGEPVGDESAFELGDERPDWSELMWLPLHASGFAAAHPGVDLFQVRADAYRVEL